MDPLTIGSHTFTDFDYDAEGDVLFLYNADPRLEADSDATPEGDCVSFDADGRLISVEILHAKRRLERDGAIKLTLPEQLTVQAAARLMAA